MELLALLIPLILGAFVWLRYRAYREGVHDDPAAEETRKLRFFLETALMVVVTVGWLVWALGGPR